MILTKIYQLGEEAFQVTDPLSGRTYVGDWEFINNCAFNEGFMMGEIIPIAGIKNAVYKNCLHEYVEMGFTQSKMICKYCDASKPLQ